MRGRAAVVVVGFGTSGHSQPASDPNEIHVEVLTIWIEAEAVVETSI